MNSSSSSAGVLALAWALSLCVGCSSDAEKDRSGGGNSGGDGDGFGNSGGDGDGFGNGAGNGAGNGSSGGPVDQNTGGGEVTGTYIWIANSAEGTVSKIDTRTMEELGRYMTNPGGNGSPSRTSVGSTGAVVVANRANGIGLWGGGAGVAKIEAEIELCVDRNGNGTIETSSGAADVLPWMEDECIAWFTPLNFYSNRPVSWAAPAGPDLPETVWTAGAVAGGCSSDACTVEAVRLNGDTGAEEARVSIGPLSGVSFTGAPALFDPLIDYGPYGGAPDAGGNFWGFIANTTHLFRVDGVTLDVLTWEIPNANAYGITVDPRGNVFTCGNGGLTRFNPATQTFDNNNGGTSLGMNGCMTDGGDIIWVGGGATGGTPGLHAFNAITLEYIETHPVGSVKGVSIDFDGNVWGVGGGSEDDRAWRVDPATGMADMFVGLTGAYSYSDMTGFGLSKAGYVPIVLE